jgi:hypothetical protein
MRKPNNENRRRNNKGIHGNSDSPVGYGRPPSHTQFKPGQSGNPKGRPKSSRNLRTIIKAALMAKIVLREGQGKRSITKLEGVVLRQVESALKGNEKAALATLRMAAHVGLLETPEGEIEAAGLSASEKEMMEELLSLAGNEKPKSKSRR